MDFGCLEVCLYGIRDSDLGIEWRSLACSLCCPVMLPHSWLPPDSPMSWFTEKITRRSRSHVPMGK